MRSAAAAATIVKPHYAVTRGEKGEFISMLLSYILSTAQGLIKSQSNQWAPASIGEGTVLALGTVASVLK